MTKYQKYIQAMFEEHKELFDAFKILHSNYEQNPDKYQGEFNKQGEKVVDIMRQYEKILCNHSEAGQYGKFSSNLADKFWEGIRKTFPKIDFVGVESS